MWGVRAGLLLQGAGKSDPSRALLDGGNRSPIKVLAVGVLNVLMRDQPWLNNNSCFLQDTRSDDSLSFICSAC